VTIRVQVALLFTVGAALVLGSATFLALSLYQQQADQYRRQADQALQVQLRRGLDSVTALLDQERLKALSGAEVVAGRVAVQNALSGGDTRQLLQLLNTLRGQLRLSRLVAVDAGGKVIVAQPATNQTFEGFGPVRQALRGQPATTALVEVDGILAYLSAAPVTSGGEVIGAIVALAQLDNTFFSNVARVTGHEAALVMVQSREPRRLRLAALSPGINRGWAFAEDKTVDPQLWLDSGDRVTLTRLGDVTYTVAQRALRSGNQTPANFLVAQPVLVPGDPLGPTRRSFIILSISATLLAAVAGWLTGWLLSRRLTILATALRAARAGAPAPRLPGGRDELGRLASEVAAFRDELAGRLAQTAGVRDRLRAVLDSLSNGIVVTDSQGALLYVNHAACCLLGLPERDDLGEQAVAPLLAALPAAGEAHELRTGDCILLLCSEEVAVADATERVRVTTIRDVTHEHALERLKGDFVSSVSHELRTPLTSIKGAVDLLLEEQTGRLTAVQRRFLQAIRRNSERLIALVSDLLDLSRIEAGRVELDLRALDTFALVRGAVLAHSDLFAARGQQVSLEVPEDVAPIHGDRQRVEQILANLLSNAAKYTPRGGRICVSARACDGYVEIAVADSGPGVPPEERELVFEKFYRGGDALTRQEQGTGLGLTIVRSLVELQGGRVWVEDAPGGGARFVFTLPRARGEEE
jgi:signal transduction histidine kinase/HAMP domain-containing protein